MTDELLMKPVIWVASCRKDLRTFPEPVQDHMGYALYVAQRGGTHRDTKTLRGFGGAGVVEVIKDFRGDTFRARNATPGYGTDRTAAARCRRNRQGEDAMSKAKCETGSRNVFKDLGQPNAEEHLVKAQLVYKIDTILRDRGLKQVEAGKLFGIPQPDVSKMLRGEFRQFSVERLLRFLVALNHDVEIVVRPHRGQGETAALHVS